MNLFRCFFECFGDDHGHWYDLGKVNLMLSDQSNAMNSIGEELTRHFHCHRRLWHGRVLVQLCRHDLQVMISFEETIDSVFVDVTQK
jgi:hypothetical protein